MIHENLSQFYGMPVKDYSPTQGAGDAARTAYRLRVDWDAREEGVTFTDLFDQYLSDKGAADTRALVIGDWGGAAEGDSAESVVKALVASCEHFPRLEALFIGDLIGEESEISWIMQTNMSAIWDAFPSLVEFGVRGGDGLRLGNLSHPSLQKLVIETGGLPVEVVREVCAAQLPELQHLELWLGDSGYGGDATAADLQPLLKENVFPKLNYLGLRNSEIVDDIAKALAGAAVLGQIKVLDLSLGTLSNEGAAALAANQGLRQLKKLDIHHHFVSPDGVKQLNALGIEIDASDAEEADEYDGEIYRYIYVAE